MTSSTRQIGRLACWCGGEDGSVVVDAEVMKVGSVLATRVEKTMMMMMLTTCVCLFWIHEMV